MRHQNLLHRFRWKNTSIDPRGFSGYVLVLPHILETAGGVGSLDFNVTTSFWLNATSSSRGVSLSLFSSDGISRYTSPFYFTAVFDT